MNYLLQKKILLNILNKKLTFKLNFNFVYTIYTILYNYF